MSLPGFFRKLFSPRQPSSQLGSLSRFALFGGLTPVELAIVEGLLHRREYLAGEVIFDEGEEGQAIYLIDTGEVELLRRGRNGPERIATLEPGAFFGDMALLDDLPRLAQARARAPTRLFAFFREDFHTLMDTHARIASKIALALAREMGRRLRVQASGEE
ncbi:MAG: cyclic nucleotide-binding domain-containing protein [Rhodocyclaceae bacterium]|nr:cyclic nucleotide-binding domain-containing protein [Rhodocyclaceae bacterium]